MELAESQLLIIGGLRRRIQRMSAPMAMRLLAMLN